MKLGEENVRRMAKFVAVEEIRYPEKCWNFAIPLQQTIISLHLSAERDDVTSSKSFRTSTTLCRIRHSSGVRHQLDTVQSSFFSMFE